MHYKVSIHTLFPFQLNYKLCKIKFCFVFNLTRSFVSTLCLSAVFLLEVWSLEGPNFPLWSWFGVFPLQCIPVVSSLYIFYLYTVNVSWIHVGLCYYWVRDWRNDALWWGLNKSAHLSDLEHKSGALQYGCGIDAGWNPAYSCEERKTGLTGRMLTWSLSKVVVTVNEIAFVHVGRVFKLEPTMCWFNFDSRGDQYCRSLLTWPFGISP